MSEVISDQADRTILRRLSDHIFDTKRWFDLKAAADELSLIRGFDRLLSLEDLPINLYDHQRTAALRVLRDMRGRAILADEVGLGKTVEAGLILREYALRGLVRRALILVPALLVNQWRAELDDKFHIHTSTAKASGDWRQHEMIVASLDRAKRPAHAAEILAIDWDIVIVDEAHHLKERSSRNWELVNGLKKKYLLLLTATPVQNNLRELYNLVTLLKPGHLMTYAKFKQEFTVDRHSPKNLHHLRERLDAVMVRTARKETLLRFPKRMVHSWTVPLQGAERDFYNRLVKLLRQAYQCAPKRERNILPLILMLREANSFPSVAARTLLSMTERGTLPGIDIQTARELADSAQNIIPGKLTRCKKLLSDEIDDKHVIIFTSFRETLQRLIEAFAGVREVHPFHGGLGSDQKAQVIERFRRWGGILVSTETGAEGMNLQFCRCVVNYDLPWNPLRLEQRIGRVHRLGQQHDVRIDNLATEGTVERYILYLLEKKIAMFDRVVGELDGILGNFSGSVESRVADTYLATDDREVLAARIEMIGHELKGAADVFGYQKSLTEQLFQSLSDGTMGEGSG